MNDTNLQLAFTEEQSMVMDAAEEFCRENSDIKTVRALLSSELGFIMEIWTKMVELGWAGITIPERFGGTDLGISALIPVVENMGRSLLTAPLISSAIAAQAILRCGTTEIKDIWLTRLAKGCIGTLAILENEDIGSATTMTAINKGGKIELRGRKILVSDAAAADFFLALCKFETDLVLVLSLIHI